MMCLPVALLVAGREHRARRRRRAGDGLNTDKSGNATTGSTPSVIETIGAM